MKTLNNGLQIEVIKVFKGQSNNYKTNSKEYADLLKVKFATGKIGVICSTEILN
jgi:hypothetical protein